MKKIAKGLSEGLIGIDLIEFYDLNGDKKVTVKEFLSASLDRHVRFIASLGTTILAILYLT